LDELLRLAQHEILRVRLDLEAMLYSYMADLSSIDKEVHQIVTKVERRHRLGVFYRILGAIIDALEEGALCNEISQGEEQVRPPSIDEIEDFLRGFGDNTFKDADRSRKYIIQKYGRDPVTGQHYDNQILTPVEFGSDEYIRRRLEGCKGFSVEAADEVLKIIQQWRTA
jgi:hypothetical protein